MNPKLTIQEKLKDLRVERRLTLEQLAEETGISKSALGKYEADDYKDISPFSIVTLAKYYGVSTDYLMGMTETKNHPNTDIHDLHLSDDMIALLRSGKLNTRLLCEMALHKDFQRMMVDIEIFVDRIADMRINDMNTVLNATRQQVIEKYSPERTISMSERWSLHKSARTIISVMWCIRTLMASFGIFGMPTEKMRLLPMRKLPPWKHRNSWKLP